MQVKSYATLMNIFFFLRNMCAHTREKERGSNTKVHHKLHSKVIVTFNIFYADELK